MGKKIILVVCWLVFSLSSVFVLAEQVTGFDSVVNNIAGFAEPVELEAQDKAGEGLQVGDVGFLLGFDWPAKPQSLSDYLLWFLSVSGFLTVLLRVLVFITGLTPSKKDDAYVTAVQRYLIVIMEWVERLSLALPGSKSRKV